MTEICCCNYGDQNEVSELFFCFHSESQHISAVNFIHSLKRYIPENFACFIDQIKIYPNIGGVFIGKRNGIDS